MAVSIKVYVSRTIQNSKVKQYFCGFRLNPSRKTEGVRFTTFAFYNLRCEFYDSGKRKLVYAVTKHSSVVDAGHVLFWKLSEKKRFTKNQRNARWSRVAPRDQKPHPNLCNRSYCGQRLHELLIVTILEHTTHVADR